MNLLSTKVPNLSIKLYHVEEKHSIYSVWYYPQFQEPTGDLTTASPMNKWGLLYSLWGNVCSDLLFILTNF